MTRIPDATPKVVIIAGPNGSGKSTLAPFLLRDTIHLLQYVDADTIAAGLSAFQPDKATFAAGRVMLGHLDTLGDKLHSFAFETTLSAKTYKPRLLKLIEGGYQFHLLYLWLQNTELAIQRVQERVRVGGHDVPSPTILRRYYGGIRNFFNIYMPLAKSWAVYDNSPGDVPQLIARGLTGNDAEVIDPALWHSFCEMGK